MAVDMFLKIKDAPGESLDAKHPGEIQILSVSWGVSNPSSMAFGAGAVGIVMAEATETGTTQAYIGNGVHAGSAVPGAPTVGNLVVEAISTNTAAAEGTAAAAGIISGAGAIVETTVTPTITAYIGNGAVIHATGSGMVRAASSGSADAQAKGASVGVGSVGLTKAEALLQPNVDSYIGSGTTASFGNTLTVEGSHTTSAGAKSSDSRLISPSNAVRNTNTWPITRPTSP